MNNDEIKERVAELQQKQNDISSEIYKLEESMKSYYLGICDDPEYTQTYVRLGFCSLTEARERIEKCAWDNEYADVKEITKEENELYYELESIFNAQCRIDTCMYCDRNYTQYKDIKALMEAREKELRSKLNIPGYINFREEK